MSQEPKEDVIDLVQVVKETKGVIVQIVVPSKDGRNSMGSGFWVDREHVATCWHVVSNNPTESAFCQGRGTPCEEAT
jgi:hypothetical protein